MSETNKQIVEKVNASFTEGNTEGFLDHCAEDVIWTMVGEKTSSGKAEIREWMKRIEGEDYWPPDFTVDTLIGEGDTVVCTGNMTLKQPDGSTGKYSYCDVYAFSGDKITALQSFVVMTGGKDFEEKSAAA